MRKPKAPRLVTVAIFTTITIVFWVFLSLYRVLTTASAPNIPDEILAPISPNLDTNALKSLPNRVFFEEGEVQPPEFSSTEPEGVTKAEAPTETPTEAPPISPTQP